MYLDIGRDDDDVYDDRKPSERDCYEWHDDEKKMLIR